MNPEPQRPVRCPKCGCSFEEHNVESEIMGPGAFLFIWACYNCGHKWIDYEIAKTNFAVSQKNQMHSNDDNYLILLMTYCRNIINTDRSGLAMALERVRRVAEGYSWIPHNEWGSYDHTERTTTTLQKEVGHLIDEIDNIAGLALNQSGERVNVHIKEVETGISAIRSKKQFPVLSSAPERCFLCDEPEECQKHLKEHDKTTRNKVLDTMINIAESGKCPLKETKECTREFDRWCIKCIAESLREGK